MPHILATLPAELLVLIYKDLNWYTTISLRLACHDFNNTYLKYKSLIDETQQRRITEPIRDWYRSMGILQEPGRNITGYKSAFTMQIMNALPYVEGLVCVNARAIDWSKQYIRHQEDSHYIVLTSGRIYILDTMRGTVLRRNERTVWEWPVEVFVRQQRQHVDDLGLLYFADAVTRPECWPFADARQEFRDLPQALARPNAMDWEMSKDLLPTFHRHTYECNRESLSWLVRGYKSHDSFDLYMASSAKEGAVLRL